MATIPLHPPATPQRFALLNLGFRPFFLGGALFALLAMGGWLLDYTQIAPLPLQRLSGWQWHAHEMIFGYAVAVVVGFLLTATRNWTGHPTANGALLGALVLLWLLARLAMVLEGGLPLWSVAALNLTFLTAATVAVTLPVIRARQWSQLVVVSKVLLLIGADGLFFLGVAGELTAGVSWGFYSGLYLIVSLVLLMLRRVFPFFLERGLLAIHFVPRNHRWVDLSSMVLMVIFLVVEGFELHAGAAAVVAALLAGVQGVRLWGWYHKAIWQVPLLWVLWLGYAAITVGFLLYALVPLGVARSLATHALAVGGIGLVTIGMMARVSLGHTGRDVFAPPPQLGWIFAALVGALLLRVLLPLLAPSHYTLWIELAQVSWMVAWGGLVAIYAAIWWQPRIDGVRG